MLTATSIDRHVEQLFDVLQRVTQALSRAGIEYRLIGGLATFIHIQPLNALAARLTQDIDIAIDRRDLQAIAEAVGPFGFSFRNVAGVDMLVDAKQPKARSAVQLIFIGEKVLPDYLEPVPGFSSPVRTSEGVMLAPVADLVRMKLTSFRLKDQVHIQDLDGVGLITVEIERELPKVLQKRLAQVRSSR